MIIVAGGDSFIFGAELQDCTGGKFSHSTYTALLAQSMKADYTCVAESGNSNTAIARQVMNFCEENRGKNIFALVTWTFTHRYEFRFNYNTDRKSSPWYSINLWDIVDDPASLKKEFVTFNESIFNAHLNNRKILNNTGLTDFAETFYKHVGNSEFYETYTSLKEILFLQQYFQVNDIPYMFVPADIYLENNDIYLRHKNDPSMKTLYDQIDWGRWYTFPAGTRANETCVPRGFYQWAVENKYPIGTTHPLEQAHIDASKLMQEKFNELVKKSIQ
jgi:hypothetical protein